MRYTVRIRSPKRLRGFKDCAINKRPIRMEGSNGKWIKTWLYDIPEYRTVEAIRAGGELA